MWQVERRFPEAITLSAPRSGNIFAGANGRISGANPCDCDTSAVSAVEEIELRQRLARFLRLQAEEFFRLSAESRLPEVAAELLYFAAQLHARVVAMERSEGSSRQAGDDGAPPGS